MKKLLILLVTLFFLISCEQPNNQSTARSATEAEMKVTASKSIENILNNITLGINTTGMERYTSWYTANFIDEEINISSVQCTTMFISEDKTKATRIVNRTYDGVLEGVTYNNEVVLEVFEEYTLTAIDSRPEINADSETTLDGNTTLDYIDLGYTLYSQHTNKRGEKGSTKLYSSATGNWEINTDGDTNPVLLKIDSQKINYYNNLDFDTINDVYSFTHTTSNDVLVIFGAEQNLSWASMIFYKD